MKKATVPRPGILPEKPTLSVCMIVRDEEKMLPRCLKSVRDVADELIVVDTGSRDNTISIARDFGAKVFHFKWCDDFAAARNESLKHANGDWILEMDADEELPRSSIHPLKEAIRNPRRLAYIVKCDDGPKAPQRLGWIGRLFRNHPSVRYSRPYHESVQPSIEKLIAKEPGWQTYYEPSIMIRHYGYEGSKLSKKYERGLRIMQSYVNSHPNDWYTWTKLGNAYYGLGSNDEAESCLKTALEINPASPEANYSLGLILQKQEKVEAAIWYYKKAIAGDRLLAEARANLGAIYVQKGMLDDAISELKEALAINPDLALAHSNLGLAYINEGKLDEGVEQLNKAVAIDPDLASAHMNLAIGYTKKGILDHAFLEYDKALNIDPDYAKAHYNLAIAYYKKGHYRKAVKHCDRAMALGAKIDPQLLELLKPHR